MKVLAVTQTDGSVWAVPVMVIAADRAKHYAHEFDDNVQRSLDEDTMPLFDNDPFEIEDWAINNMNWSDVASHAFKMKEAPPPDFQEGWVNGTKNVVALTA